MPRQTENRHTPAKASFADYYDRPHPRRYFSALRPLVYSMPDSAQPVIANCVSALRQLRGKSNIHMLDLCAGYGLNGCLARHDLTLEDLYDYYDHDRPDPELARRLAADHAHFAPLRRADRSLRVTGQDVAGLALDYAHKLGFIDDAIHANLERRAPRPGEARLLADVDLITVTGGMSYIGAATLRHVLGTIKTAPWVLYFPLRHGRNDGVHGALSEMGMEVEQSPQPIPQRRFKDLRERHAALTRMEAMSVPGDGPPSSTHLEALLCLARPAHEATKLPFAQVVNDEHAAAPAKRSDVAPVLLGK